MEVTNRMKGVDEPEGEWKGAAGRVRTCTMTLGANLFDEKKKKQYVGLAFW